MNTFEQTIEDVGSMLGHNVFHRLMAGDNDGRIDSSKEAAVIALIYDLEIDLVEQDLDRVAAAAKDRLFALQAENIREHAQGNEAKAQMVAVIQTRADRAAVQAAREALASCGDGMSSAAKAGIAKFVDEALD